ncbi:MAG: LysM peptidoglycan-binding domain-containing protein, partial [Candidatus Pacebacteria bacterium]|nr:LysM peptidoglycan-binding domain-containing protein [Candidatus Paceibacterota bacterium]
MLFSGLFYKKFLFILVLLIIPNILYAGFFSFISEFFTKNVEINVSQENVQNMTLLQGVLNPMFNPASGGGDIVVVGGSALLPETGPNGEDAGKNKPSSDQISLYVVREGDSLSQIAEMFNVSVNTIVWGNNLRGTTITPGQTLVILPVSG